MIAHDCAQGKLSARSRRGSAGRRTRTRTGSDRTPSRTKRSRHSRRRASWSWVRIATSFYPDASTAAAPLPFPYLPPASCMVFKPALAAASTGHISESCAGHSTRSKSTSLSDPPPTKRNIFSGRVVTFLLFRAALHTHAGIETPTWNLSKTQPTYVLYFSYVSYRHMLSFDSISELDSSIRMDFGSGFQPRQCGPQCGRSDRYGAFVCLFSGRVAHGDRRPRLPPAAATRSPSLPCQPWKYSQLC